MIFLPELNDIIVKMWETIKEIATSDNSIVLFVFILTVLIVICVLAKNNYLKIDTQTVKIGGDEKERAIIRQQIEWSNQFINGLYGDILERFPESDKLLTRYILELVYDEVITWISFNHITKSDMYIMVKQEKICSTISSIDFDKKIWNDEFKEMMNEWTKTIIYRLVDIRMYYLKK